MDFLDNFYVDDDAKVRELCHATEKYICSAHRDWNIKVKLIHKIPVVFHNLRSSESRLIMQELGKSNLK